jgi:S-adenosylmethionine hydrolase
MSIITLTTDFGLKDYYLGALKGKIIRECPQARIIDISHEISKHSIVEAAFVLKNAFPEFPEGSIHLIGVKTQTAEQIEHVIVKYRGHFFIGTDNGVFSMLLEEKPEKVLRLAVRPDSELLSFPTKDVLAKAACHLARGGTMEVIGQPHEGLAEKETYVPIVEGNSIRGSVIYIDSYSNAVTNISKDMFERLGKGRSFSIDTKVRGYSMSKIRKQYNEVSRGERLAIFGTNGLLEICMNEGNAGQLMNLKFSDTVTITFEE